MPYICFLRRGYKVGETNCGQVIADLPFGFKVTSAIPVNVTCPKCREDKSVNWSIPFVLSDGSEAMRFA